MELELTTDRHSLITSQWRYPLCHAALHELEGGPNILHVNICVMWRKNCQLHAIHEFVLI